MSKIKMSFSLILAIFLVGILSTAAFAKDPYGLKPVQQSDLSLLVPFTGNSADPLDVQGRSFDVILKDDLGAPVGSPYVATLDSSKKASISIAKGTIPFGKVYTVELYHTDDNTHATLLSKSTAVVTDPHNGTLLNETSSPKTGDDATVTLDKNGNGLKNANLTGYNNTRKNRTGQKVHGFYQNNTNSCASCHQTHTGQDGNLLFKNGVYSTCSACHDGTTGAYNAWGSVSKETTAEAAGTFNNPTGHNGSLHEADGSLKVSAAPGGNTAGGQFNQEFDCASCHSPHGNGSAGENNLNLDPLEWGSVTYATDTNDHKNGKLFKNIPIYAKAAIPTTMDTPYILVKLTLADQAAVDANFFYKRAIGTVTGPVEVIQTYRWNGSKKYVPDYSLWLREKGYPYKADSVLYKAAWGSLTPDSHGYDKTNDANKDVTVVWRDGFAYGAAVPTILSAQISIGVDVETTSEIASLFDAADVAYIPESGIQMSKYCAGCHTDYLSATRNDVTGNYTSAHRHQTASDELTCVRCHYGHGTEAQIMKDANDNTYYDLTDVAGTYKWTDTAAIDYLKDPNPSSALKRYTGMAVCFACHGGGEQFLGNANNGTGAQALTGKLKAGKPGEEVRSDY